MELKVREIIKYIWLRICRRVYGHKYDCCHIVTRNCRKCPICPMNGVNISQCRKIAFEEPEITEKTVMAWAAEHREPVYPTWREYLMDLILPNSPSGNFATFLLEQYIPDDIAQKLGIEPKEGV